MEIDRGSEGDSNPLIIPAFSSVAFRLAIGLWRLDDWCSRCHLSGCLFRNGRRPRPRDRQKKILMISDPLIRQFGAQGLAGVAERIQHLSTDSVDQDTEDYLLLGPTGQG
jgi:hypothetical protein